MDKAKSILVVDDEELVRLNLTAFLEDEGFAVISADSAEDALCKVNEQGAVDLAIVDMHLPEMDGNELIHILHEKREAHDFLIYTGFTDYKPPPAVVSAGVKAQDIFYKPIFDMNVMLNAIHKKISTSV